MTAETMTMAGRTPQLRPLSESLPSRVKEEADAAR